eukprot:3242076-Alexandrium_andersonii.AAC.1
MARETDGALAPHEVPDNDRDVAVNERGATGLGSGTQKGKVSTAGRARGLARDAPCAAGTATPG